jgi:hypothetical protein
MTWKRWALLMITLTLAFLAFGYHHQLLEWWRFDRFGTHQPITESDYRALGENP